MKVQPTSRAMVKGTALAEGAGLGVNVTATDGGLYDGKDAGYLNILYTASGTGANQEWNSTTPVMLSGTEGKMYAYYPHTPGVDFKAITVDITAQHDWMYGAEAYTVNDKAATAAVVLKHAQTAVNVNVVRDATYTGVGSVSALSVTSEGLASSGTLDTRDGSWSAVDGANTAISIISAPFTLDGSTLTNQENPYMFIPASGETKDFVVTATVDGKTYSSSVTMKEAFAKGKMYSVSLKITNVGLTVSEVTLVDWDEVLLDEGIFQPGQAATPSAPVINSAGKANGVYIVTAAGELVDKTTAAADAIGVALITANQRILIEKMGEANTDIIQAAYTADAATVTDCQYFYWGSYGTDVTDITNISDITAAKADFSGKANTAAIIATPDTDSYTEFANMGTYCTKFNEMSGTYADWYIPACGQLYEIYTNVTDINAALTSIGGTKLDTSNSYWSSSEYNFIYGWHVLFNDGYVYNYVKEYMGLVRVVRDIE